MPTRAGYEKVTTEIPMEIMSKFRDTAKKNNLVMRGVVRDLIIKWVNEQEEIQEGKK